MTLEFSEVILGPITYVPEPFPHIADTLPTGELEIASSNNLICESKGGSIGAEDIQCWEKDSENPIIMNFQDVKKITLPDQQMFARRLDKLSERQLQSDALQINCIKSESNLEGVANIHLNYERCLISNNIFEITAATANGVGITTFDSTLDSMYVQLPSPSQIGLTTVFQSCDAEWYVYKIDIVCVV